MSPPTERQLEKLDRAMCEVQRRYTSSPLDHIRKKFEELLDGTKAAIESGNQGPEDANNVVQYVEDALEILPQSFGDRFYFDAMQIQTLVNYLSQGATKLSQMILPRPHREWGHASLSMPSEFDGRHHVVDLIYIPGEDHIDDIDLPSYAFLCHELTHNLFFRDDSIFTRPFESTLTRTVNALRLSSISDRGSMRTHARNAIDELYDVWNPSPNQRNWAHELAVDVIGLWLCGSAYLTALDYVLLNPETNPYQIDHWYPPYEVRCISLLLACDKLGWPESAEGLRETIASWNFSKWKSMKNNQYLSLLNRDLVEDCVASAMDACKSLALPQCTPSRLVQIRKDLQEGTHVPEFGLDLILAASVMKKDSGEPQYEKWQKKTIQILLKSIIR